MQLSVPAGRRTPLCGFGVGSKYRSTAARPASAAAAPQEWRAAAGECGQCHVVSVRR